MTTDRPRRLHRPWLTLSSELIERMQRTEEPASRTVARFLREHPKIGRRDQAFIVEVAWEEQRRWRVVDAALAASAGPPHAWDRALVTATIGLGWRPEEWPVDDAHRARLQSGLAAAGELAAEGGLAATGDVAHDGADHPAHRHAARLHGIPDVTADAWAERFGSESAARLIAGLRERAPTSLRVNTARTSREAVLNDLESQGVEARPGRWSRTAVLVTGRLRVESWDAWAKGHVELQDEGSQLLVEAAGVRSGDLVIDVCSGAGGKTLAFADLAGARGRVVGLESEPGRLARMEPRRVRAGATNVEGRLVPGHTLLSESTRDLVGAANVVFVDAPCTGWGALRRSPELARRAPSRAPADLLALQARLLREAASLVAPGGSLVWATCSMFAEENEGIADEFDAATAGSGPWVRDERTTRIDRLPESVWARGLLLRPDVHGTDGFWLARWRRSI